MEPVTLIVSALTAGATAALQETAGTAIKDAYQGLAGLVRKKFGKDTKAKTALDGSKEDPETWQKPLEKSVQESGIANDKEILGLAQELIKLLKSQNPSSKYNVKIKGSKQIVVGDNAKVTMNLNEQPRKLKTRKPSKKQK
ncbi:MAG: hypothetical protein IT315_11145 [Anaerolineales bacterium]|nr:hypothetical protein [Anaerolineales bacterium]